MPVGVLAVQGAVSEHAAVLEGLGEEVVLIKNPAQLECISALIIPGGESTTLGKFLSGGLGEAIKRLAGSGAPVYGTCTGMIALCRVRGSVPKTLGIMDAVVRRNAFGRQVDSFEEDIPIPAIGEKPFHCVFIRAPVIEKAGSGVEVLARSGGNAVFARQGNLLASSFHPELTGDTRVHEYFLSMRGM